MSAELLHPDDATEQDEPPDRQDRVGAGDAVGRLARSQRLSQRRLVQLPAHGPGAPVTRTQGRGPSEALSPEGLSELASSIATFGLLQPILVEESDGTRVVVAGERRLRAFLLALRDAPDNPLLRPGIWALVCPGPLEEEERRIWQIAENLCRADLAPGELGQALLFERCAVLVERLGSEGLEVDPADASWPDPVQRWERLERTRKDLGAHHVGAPWPEVLHRLGMQLGEASARKIVRAFTSLPPGMAEQMDEAGVRLHARTDLLRLGRGRQEAAAELWEAVRARRCPELLGSAAKMAVADPQASPEEALRRAEAFQVEADAGRARQVAEHWASGARGGDQDPGLVVSEREPIIPDGSREPSPPVGNGVHNRPASTHLGPPDVGDAGVPDAESEPVVMECSEAIAALRSALGRLRSGERPSRYDLNSLRLLCQEMGALLDVSHEQAQSAMGG